MLKFFSLCFYIQQIYKLCDWEEKKNVPVQAMTRKKYQVTKSRRDLKVDILIASLKTIIHIFFSNHKRAFSPANDLLSGKSFHRSDSFHTSNLVFQAFV